MANRERGEAAIDVDGRRYTIRPSMNALCQSKEFTGVTAPKFFHESSERAKAGDPDPNDLRIIAWIYLQACHGDEIKTLNDAGAWIDRAGTDALGAALGELNAENSKAIKRASGGRPRKAQVETTAQISGSVS